jgi:hypothetical protein
MTVWSSPQKDPDPEEPAQAVASMDGCGEAAGFVRPAAIAGPSPVTL